MNNGVQVYEPDNSLKKGFIATYGEILAELAQNKWLTLQLFKRQFFAAYKQSYVGILWRFITPLVSMGTFVLLNRSGVFSAGDIKFPYPLYALTGITFWQIFAMGLVAGSNSLALASSMITKINFSRKSLVIASISQSCLTFLIQFLLVMFTFLCYRMTPGKGVFLIPIVIIPLFLFTLGISFFLSIINSIMRDISNFLSILVTFLMFLTPVLYAKPKIGILTKMTEYNPLYYMVQAGRDLMLTGRILEPKGFIISCAVSVFLFVFCLRLFHITEARITERI